MPRYIDADLFKQCVQENITRYFTCGAGGYCLAEDVVEDIDAFPTADVIPKEFLTRREGEAYERGYAEGKTDAAREIDIITDTLIDDLLIDFDEMGFVPTTTVPDPNAYAIDWKNKLINALQGYRKQSAVIDEFVERIKNEFSEGISFPSDYVEIQYIHFCEIIDKLAKSMKGGAE